MQHKNRKIILRWRKAEERDANFLLKLRNEIAVRRSALQSKTIKRPDHLRWLNTKLSDQNCLIFILLKSSGRRVGQIRYDFKPDRKAMVDIAIDPLFRGKGYGSLGLIRTAKYILQKSQASRIIALVKETNQASKKLFLNANFRITRRMNVKQNRCFRLELAK